MFKVVHSVMFFVADVNEACRWYSNLVAVKPEWLLPGFPILRIGNIEVCFHQADDKVSSGRASVVTYWEVEDFQNAVLKALQLGGTVYRGPLEIENESFICQILDPFGNLFGLAGKKMKAPVTE